MRPTWNPRWLSSGGDRDDAEDATLDAGHVVAISAGGETTEDNLITACETCNHGKSARLVVQRTRDHQLAGVAAGVSRVPSSPVRVAGQRPRRTDEQDGLPGRPSWEGYSGCALSRSLEAVLDNPWGLAVGDHVRATGNRAGLHTVAGIVTSLTDDGFDVYLDSLYSAEAGGWRFPERTLHVLAADVGEVERSAPAAMVRRYKGASQADTLRDFEIEAAVLSKAGYIPTTQSWTRGQWGTSAWILAFLALIFVIGIIVLVYMIAVRPAGELVVTYEFKPTAMPSGRDETTRDGPTKVCPQCAEEVKAAALLCRFCRYEFGQPPPPGPSGA